MGLIMSGSAAKTFTSQPGGTRKRLSDSSGVRYGWPEGRVLTNPNSPWANATGRRTQKRRTAALRNRIQDIDDSHHSTGELDRRKCRVCACCSQEASEQPLAGKFQVKGLGIVKGVCRRAIVPLQAVKLPAGDRVLAIRPSSFLGRRAGT